MWVAFIYKKKPKKGKIMEIAKSVTINKLMKVATVEGYICRHIYYQFLQYDIFTGAVLNEGTLSL